jgi:hypothetical protein
MLIRKVEKFLRKHDMAATKFGRLAAHDPRFVLDLRMGRIPRPATEERTLQWMEQYEAAPEKIALPARLKPAAPSFESRRVEPLKPKTTAAENHRFETKGYARV